MSSPFCHKMNSTTNMSEKKTYDQVANIAEYSGIPYVENLAKVAILCTKWLETKGTNAEYSKELCESIGNTIVTIDTVTRMEKGMAETYFKDISMEIEQYLKGIVRDIPLGMEDYLPQSAPPDHGHIARHITVVIETDQLRDAIQAYKRRVDDLKLDFLIHLTGDCMTSLGEITRMQSMICESRASYFSEILNLPALLLLLLLFLLFLSFVLLSISF
ncbi:hypothetical protein IW261DRAFT_1521091 [Armillaria novae-zelandiae]|uniref:Uncharacterized protein n=1 Tax=Armillaria novae-zelandiae TaxID=153914 RepID=A0AA39NJA4_9AGAR|nr:hypothetical protein IW261DRAFT_1521091 [Armillaria novae-zelandiae]